VTVLVRTARRARQRRRFVIELQARSDTDDIHALRAILKTLLRRFGWRCTAARETHADASPPASRGISRRHFKDQS
jgi:hypothetical protein